MRNDTTDNAANDGSELDAIVAGAVLVLDQVTSLEPYLQPLAIGWAPARKQITFLLGLADTEHARLLTFPDNVLAIFCGCSQSVRRAHAWRH